MAKLLYSVDKQDIDAGALTAHSWVYHNLDTDFEIGCELTIKDTVYRYFRVDDKFYELSYCCGYEQHVKEVSSQEVLERIKEFYRSFTGLII